MCFVPISGQTATFALQNIKRLVFITEVESVYSTVRTESYIKQTRFVFKGLNKKLFQISKVELVTAYRFYLKHFSIR
jgi:hypothetical protein